MQLRKVTLKAVNNKKEKTCGILIDTARGEEWANSFKTSRTEQLNKEETVYIWLYEEEYQGKNYLKFKLPSMDHLMALGTITPKTQENVSQRQIEANTSIPRGGVSQTAQPGDPNYIDVNSINF